MNGLAASLAWGGVQATLLALLGTVLYAVCRRRGPAAGAFLLATVLSLLIPLGFVGLFALPGWYRIGNWPVHPNAAPREHVVRSNDPSGRADGSAWALGTDGAAASMAQSDAGARHSTSAGNPFDRAASGPWMSVSQTFWNSFVDALRMPQSTAPALRNNSTRGVWLVFLLGWSAALLRWVGGYWAAECFRRRSSPVTSHPVRELVDELRAAFGCAAAIDVRSCDRIESPATIGWRRPLIVLPESWETWTGEELRAVMAHEVAHVARQDFLIWLLAQLSVAMHYYHPLVHWLARRLQIEQEMAADHCAALAVGGRPLYLRTLARMALREDDRRRWQWALRPFLPSSTTFVRRIEMLRRGSNSSVAVASRGFRGLVLGMLITAATLIAGVRGPAPGFAQSPAGAGATSAENDGDNAASTNRGDIEPAYMSSSPLLVVQVRPASFLARDSSQVLAKLLREDLQIEQQLGFPPEEIASVTTIITHAHVAREGAKIAAVPQRVIVRSKSPRDWSGLVKKILPQHVPAAFRGKAYAVGSADARKGAAVWVPDDSTLVYAASDAEMRTLIIDLERPTPADWHARWQDVATGDLAVYGDMRQLDKTIAQLLASDKRRSDAGSIAAMLAVFSPLWEQSNHLHLGSNIASGDGLVMALTTSSADSAQRVEETLASLLTLARNGVDKARDSLAGAGESEQVLVGNVVAAAHELLDHATVRRSDNVVELTSTSSAGAVPMIASVVLPAVAKARDAALGAQNMNNLRQITLAMHQYHEAHGHFPPAECLGPDGKHVHSWRVALLPYLSHQELYDKYHKDEPWDSDHNRKLLDEMPAVFRHPMDAPTSTNTSYVVLTGPETMFHGNKSMRYSDVRDGLSNTIMVVDVKREIPWTKPEDIPYDAEQPIPTLGGWFKDAGFHVAMADGSVRWMSRDVASAELRNAITPDSRSNPLAR